ncbi:MAG: hypothetical protein R6X02_32805 [Enhygromyxa sp.]
MRSLFIVSLPRSLSSLVYQVARRSLGVDDLAWTSDGELLNPDRHASYGRAEGRALKYTRRWAPERRFERMHAYLDELVRPEGRVYKDVVQPFVLASWLKDRKLAILYIRRPLADVVFAMQAQGWSYPARAVAPPDRGEDQHDQSEAAVVAGLLAARRALEQLPAERVDYDELISDEAALPAALNRLYPHRNLAPVDYLDEFFAERRAATLARRSSPSYRALEGRIAQLISGWEHSID